MPHGAAGAGGGRPGLESVRPGLDGTAAVPEGEALLLGDFDGKLSLRERNPDDLEDDMRSPIFWCSLVVCQS